MEKRERVERRQRQREVGRKGRRSKWGENMQGGRRGGRKRGNNKIRWGGQVMQHFDGMSSKSTVSMTAHAGLYDCARVRETSLLPL